MEAVERTVKKEQKNPREVVLSFDIPGIAFFQRFFVFFFSRYRGKTPADPTFAVKLPALLFGKLALWHECFCHFSHLGLIIGPIE